MIDQTMRISLLPAPVINKGFIQGEQDCNYEVFLLELINQSSWFSEHYPGGFVSPSSEANGECDAINKKYQLDFKLFAARTALRARNLQAPQITKIADGAYAYSVSRRPNLTLQATRLFAAFRGKSLDELYDIRSNAKEEYSIEKDISAALEILETQKNLLLFFPYVISFDVFHEQTAAIESIKEGIDNDFLSAFLYRERFAKSFDCFFTCIYENQFIIFQIYPDGVQFCELVHVNKTPTFTKLKSHSD